jgi:hypothetical protein
MSTEPIRSSNRQPTKKNLDLFPGERAPQPQHAQLNGVVVGDHQRTPGGGVRGADGVMAKGVRKWKKTAAAVESTPPTRSGARMRRASEGDAGGASSSSIATPLIVATTQSAEPRTQRRRAAAADDDDAGAPKSLHGGAGAAVDGTAVRSGTVCSTTTAHDDDDDQHHAHSGGAASSKHFTVVATPQRNSIFSPPTTAKRQRKRKTDSDMLDWDDVTKVRKLSAPSLSHGADNAANQQPTSASEILESLDDEPAATATPNDDTGNTAHGANGATTTATTTTTTNAGIGSKFAAAKRYKRRKKSPGTGFLSTKHVADVVIRSCCSANARNSHAGSSSSAIRSKNRCVINFVFALA